MKKKYIIFMIILLLFLIGLSNNKSLASFYIEDFEINSEILSNGDMKVEENITYYSTETKNGVTREINIKNSNNDSEIIGENAGGMVGWSNKAFIYSCHLTPNSIVSGIDNAGGFVGYAYGGAEIYNSMSLGTVRSEIKAGRICRSK